MKLTITKTINQGGAFIYKIAPTNIMIANQDAHNTAEIEFELPAEWQGLTVRATFTPNGKKPIEMLIFDNAIELKSDITSESGVLVVDAFDDNVHYYTTDCQYKVAKHAPVGGVEPEYTPTEIEQVLSQVQVYVNEANTAKEQALGAAQYVEDVKSDIAAEKSNIEQFVADSKQDILNQTTDSKNAVMNAGTESIQNAERAIQQQTAIGIKSIEDKSSEQQQAISEFVKNEAQQIVSDSKVELENKTNLSKTDIENLALLKKQEIIETAENKKAEINADDTVQKVNTLVSEVDKLKGDLSNKVGYAEISGTTITLYADDTKGKVIKNIEIPSATDEHINSLIDAKLGVIENGSY